VGHLPRDHQGPRQGGRGRQHRKDPGLAAVAQRVSHQVWKWRQFHRGQPRPRQIRRTARARATEVRRHRQNDAEGGTQVAGGTPQETVPGLQWGMGPVDEGVRGNRLQESGDLEGPTQEGVGGAECGRARANPQKAQVLEGGDRPAAQAGAAGQAEALGRMRQDQEDSREDGGNRPHQAAEGVWGCGRTQGGTDQAEAAAGASGHAQAYPAGPQRTNQTSPERVAQVA